MLRCGIIGCGRIVQGGHVDAFKALRDRIEVVALADPAQSSLDAVGEALGVERKYEDYREMLAKEALDFVDIATPHFAHRDNVVDVANAGVHILSEKPMATNLEEADTMLEAVEKNGVRYCVLHNYIYGGALKRAIALVQEGAIGEVFFIRSEGLGWGHFPGVEGFDSAWRTKMARGGGGCLIDNGYHNIYSGEYLMNSPVVSVYASVGTFVQPIDVDDLAVLMLKHKNGGITSIQVSWAVKARGVGVYEIHGTKGTLTFHREDHPLALYRNDTEKWEYPSTEVQYEGFTGIFYEFVEALEKGTGVPISGHKARHNLQIIMSAYQSAKTGKVVAVA
ncbi:MAG: Gfo/Idh/MocA family oxidoreductase [Candidatus Latescibacteria bacterium]|nr:Gfo/Idh/MocA family oxidoreductase [Candidatus Latescibacterota bacterium]